MTARSKARRARRQLRAHDHGNDRHVKGRQWLAKRERLTTEWLRAMMSR